MYFHQTDSWNSINFLTKLVQGFDQIENLQDQIFLHFVHNSSAYAIVNKQFKYLAISKPPVHNTSSLLPVDACVGPSFKVTFKRALVQHVVPQVYLHITLDKKSQFELSDAIIFYGKVPQMVET